MIQEGRTVAVGDDCQDQGAKAGRSAVNPPAEGIGKEEHVASEQPSLACVRGK